MTPASIQKLTLTASIPSPGVQSNARQIRSALRRCNDAWKRAYDACLQKEKIEPGQEDTFWHAQAAKPAAAAYCRAMPLLFGSGNIHTFLACVAHGILIGAIPREKGSQLLYAAQVAHSTILRTPAPRKSA